VANFNRLVINIQDFLGYRDRPKKKKIVVNKKKICILYVYTYVLHFFYSISVYNLVFHSYLLHFLSIIFIFIDRYKDIQIYRKNSKIQENTQGSRNRLVDHPWHIGIVDIKF
jgi:hypothetical protein